MKPPLDPQLAKALKKVIDPELGIDIVSLGLVYKAKSTPPDKAYIQMTLTSPGCPLAFIFEEEVKDKLKKAGFKTIKIDLTFDPPWTPNRLSASAKAQLSHLL